MAGISIGLSGHPYYLDGIHQLPTSLLKQAEVYLPKVETVTGVFVIPPGVYSRGFRWQRNPLQALVFTHRGVLHVLAPDRGKQAVNGTWLSAEDIVKIRLSLILLYGKLEIWGTHADQGAKIEVEYNTVAHRFLSPSLKETLRKTWKKNPAHTGRITEDPDFPNFFNTSYSFYSGLTIEAIQPGEVVLGCVYQPELRVPWMKYFHRSIAPKTVLALTSQQLILLQEDLKFQTHHEWIFTFIPRHRIARLDQETENNWQKLAFHTLPENAGQSIVVLLDADVAQKWVAVWNKNFTGEEK